MRLLFIVVILGCLGVGAFFANMHWQENESINRQNKRVAVMNRMIDTLNEATAHSEGCLETYNKWLQYLSDNESESKIKALAFFGKACPDGARGYYAKAEDVVKHSESTPDTAAKAEFFAASLEVMRLQSKRGDDFDAINTVLEAATEQNNAGVFSGAVAAQITRHYNRQADAISAAEAALETARAAYYSDDG
ncbi:hypothetical protein KO498_11290 [Lentibacter algarum]|uniref:hypothetical protein n=1 Tax=Lentibacter algarum TaxID=576131 RepID=UPI001C0A02E2|nr:hypothetical protein [Lentibacter algarum]MBU2982392.1 hypothetical protein [Lentibacter algarum]